ncbi:MAG: hypothetical protein KAU50_02130, partial [Candidatus Marinimicrobia bacterium]|nr:hypothetical protein [Candidatus Neomarinimicrobiota bacterium]
METKDMHRHNPFIAFIVVALIVTVSLDGQSIQFGGPDLEFIEYEYNPVLDGKSSWAYLAVSGPDVMFDNGIYKMWFNGVSDMGQEIGYATSTDGLNWEIYPEPVLSHLDSASANETLVKWPEVIKVGNQYWMYYTACDTLGIFQLYLATSDDGISWARYSPETILGIGPSGSFDAEYVGYARIIQWNGQYAMWYSGAESIAEARFQVGFATSPDGLTWTKYSSNPVMDYFIDDGEEYYHICAGSPIVHADNSLEMFYTGRISNPPSQINHAWSTDGINWTPSPANPLITHGGPGSWNEGNTSQPAVLLHDGRYKIWYGGYSSAGWRTWAIGYGAATPVGSRTLYATDTRWVAGDTINVEIKLSQTAGVAGIDFTVTYDSLLLHFAGIDKASATNDFLLVENS